MTSIPSNKNPILDRLAEYLWEDAYKDPSSLETAVPSAHKTLPAIKEYKDYPRSALGRGAAAALGFSEAYLMNGATSLYALKKTVGQSTQLLSETNNRFQRLFDQYKANKTGARAIYEAERARNPGAMISGEIGGLVAQTILTKKAGNAVGIVSKLGEASLQGGLGAATALSQSEDHTAEQTFEDVVTTGGLYAGGELLGSAIAGPIGRTAIAASGKIKKAISPMLEKVWAKAMSPEIVKGGSESAKAQLKADAALMVANKLNTLNKVEREVAIKKLQEEGAGALMNKALESQVASGKQFTRADMEEIAQIAEQQLRANLPGPAKEAGAAIRKVAGTDVTQTFPVEALTAQKTLLTRQFENVPEVQRAIRKGFEAKLAQGMSKAEEQLRQTASKEYGQLAGLAERYGGRELTKPGIPLAGPVLAATVR